MNNNALKEHLKHVDLTILQNKIRHFRTLPIKSMDRRDIAHSIMQVLCFETPSGLTAILAPTISWYPQGTRFYRVRPLQPTDTAIPPKDMRFIDDAWNPPSHVVKAGRINLAKESLLYTSPITPSTAIAEMKVEEGVFFSLIVYEAMSQINVVGIGLDSEIPDLSVEERLKLALLNDFLTHEFTKDVGVGTEYLYKASEIIAKDYFDLPPQVQDAWCYPSVAERPSVNVCFRPGVAKDKLRLLGVQIASFKTEGETRLLEVKYVISGVGQDRVFQCHAIGSQKQLEVFPEIKSKS